MAKGGRDGGIVMPFSLTDVFAGAPLAAVPHGSYPENR
jgi:hypothetical protein